MSTDAKRIDQLRRQIDRHNRLYYVEAKTEISDQAYDQLLAGLRLLEEKHPNLITPESPTQRVGGGPIAGFQPVTHAVRMFSIDNTYQHKDLLAWHERVVKGIKQADSLFDQSIDYLLEPKIDGVAVSLRYERGRLVLGASRGDGYRGDDVTGNIRTIASVPLRLASIERSAPMVPDILEVRGEIFMLGEEFDRINQLRADLSQELYANPRNVTAGTLKLLDPRQVATRNLQFIVHGRGQIEPNPFTCHSEFMAAIRDWGFPVNPMTRCCHGIDEAWQFIESFENKRESLSYEVDGVVIKVDSYVDQQRLGTTSKSPRWCIAYKYAAQQATTTLNAITWQVGKGGTLTPVAELASVFLAGTTVKRAGLHNIDEIRRKDIRVGDRVVLEKAGEIIPQVVRVVMEARSSGSEVTGSPTHCPSCSEPVIREEDQAATRCVNPQCPAQLRERLIWFAARNQMNIDTLGEKLVSQLVDVGFLKSFADIYRLKNHADKLADLDRMGKKKVQNLLTGITRSKNQGLARLLGGLGIRHVGTRAADIIADHFGSMDRLVAASQEDLASIDEIGAVTAQSVHRFVQSAAARGLIEDFRHLGVILTASQKPQVSSESPFLGKTIVLTGSLTHFDRGTLKEKLQALGAKVTDNVSKKTDLVIFGQSPGSKLTRAKQLEIEVWNEEELLENIKGT